jgi:hypothetical protein
VQDQETDIGCVADLAYILALVDWVSGGDYGMVYDSMNIGGQYQPYGNAGNYADHSQYSERPPTPPSPSERSESPPPQQLLAHGNWKSGQAIVGVENVE